MNKRSYLPVLLILFLSSFGSASAAVFYVTPTSDSDCSDFHCDFQNALNAASLTDEGDTVYLGAGSYNAATGTFVWNTTKNYPLSITGSDGTIVDGKNAASCLRIITSNQANDANAHVTITNVFFQNCSAPLSQGAALFGDTTDANLTVLDSTFHGNVGGDGGGAYVYCRGAGTVQFKNNILVNNLAQNFAGGGLAVLGATGQVTIERNLFYENSSNSHGAGVYVATGSGSIVLVNNMIYANMAQSIGGGALLATTSGIVTVTNNTFTANSANNGGGLNVSLSADTAVTNIYNNIIWNNLAANYGDDIDLCDNCGGITATSVVNLYNNNFSDVYSQCANTTGCIPLINQGNNKNVNPKFVNASDPDPENWDLRLFIDSESIDTGDSAACPATDQIGIPRPQDGDKNGSVSCDMGAYEMPSNVMLASPNGGETLASGYPYRIAWGAPSQARRFKLMYSFDNGITWKIITNTATIPHHNWNVPTPSKNRTKCLIKVVGYDNKNKKIGAAISENPFAIEVVKLTAPNGGPLALFSDQPLTVTWITNRTTNFVAYVTLIYTLNGGTTWKLLANVFDNPGTYSGTVPLVTTTKNKSKIKVLLRDSIGRTVGTDTSDGWIIISP